MKRPTKSTTKKDKKSSPSTNGAHSFLIDIETASRAELIELANRATTLGQLEAIEAKLEQLRKKKPTADDVYAKKKRREAARQREKSRNSRDIAASCPECKCTKTRDRILSDLKFALETLFPDRFNMPWGPDHLKFLAQLENAMDNGDQLAVAMPRGQGKTSTLVCSVIVAILKGKHQFVALIAATAVAAVELLEQITTYFETNQQLYDYFPELIHPIRKLEGIRQRRLLWNGEVIKQEWKKDRIILPNVAGAHGASAIIKAAGLLGRIRGMSYQRPDGVNVRPSLCLVDDPQTDDSAISPKQNAKREKTLCQTIPGLAGPGKKISILVACTVIAPDDLADRVLSREKHPEFRGIRTKLMRSEPTNKDLWNEYAEIYRECLRTDEDITRATAFYKKNRDAMDIGADPSWPARFNEDEISAVQYAMNIKIRNPEGYAAEYQNEPLVFVEFEKTIDPDELTKRLSGYRRGAVPLPTEYITAGIDVQKNYLVWTLAAFEPNATGYVIDYGTWPDQKLNYYDRRTATKTLETAFPGQEEAAQLWSAIGALCAELFARQFLREDDNHPMSLRRVCIDVRYKGDAIKRFVKQSPHKDLLLPAQGIHVNPGSPGINDREAKPGEISKHDFRLPPLGNGQIARTVSFDSAEYITKVHDALLAKLGGKGTLTLFNAEPHLHRCYADQVCAELPTIVEAKGRKKKTWALKPGGPDNDYLDSTKLAMLAAYTLGMEPSYVPPKAKPTGNPGRAPRCSVV